MPVERRSLRSNKDSSTSTNGEKNRPNTQSSGSKEKAAPTTRAAANKAKAAAAPKKGAKANGEEQPHANGSEPVENGVNGSQDVEMGEESKQNKDGDGDEEMTVVVPPSKGSRLSGEPGQEKDEDVSMEGAEGDDAKAQKVEVDPKVKAVSGKFR